MLASDKLRVYTRQERVRLDAVANCTDAFARGMHVVDVLKIVGF